MATKNPLAAALEALVVYDQAARALTDPAAVRAVVRGAVGTVLAPGLETDWLKLFGTFGGEVPAGVAELLHRCGCYPAAPVEEA